MRLTDNYAAKYRSSSFISKHAYLRDTLKGYFAMFSLLMNRPELYCYSDCKKLLNTVDIHIHSLGSLHISHCVADSIN